MAEKPVYSADLESIALLVSLIEGLGAQDRAA